MQFAPGYGFIFYLYNTEEQQNLEDRHENDMNVRSFFAYQPFHTHFRDGCGGSTILK